MRTWLISESNGDSVRHLKDDKYGKTNDLEKSYGEKTNGESITDEIIIEMHIYIKGTSLL